MTKSKLYSLALCLLVLAGSIGVLQWRSLDADTRLMKQAQAQETTPVAYDNTEPKTTAVTPVSPVEARIVEGGFSLGSPDAPITIMEYSSFSCPHCAHFHRDTLPDLKKDYIDTGKIRMVFHDFPLNEPAIAGTLLMKCIPIENRYEFMEMLFAQQTQWAFQTGYTAKLQQYAALLGIDNETSGKCMTDKETGKEMFTIVKAESDKYEIDSTPTFVFLPGDEKITGAAPYSDFSTKIESMLRNMDKKAEEE